MRWLKKHLFVAALLAALLILGVALVSWISIAIWQFFDARANAYMATHLDKLGYLSNTGQYLSFTIGTPLTLFTTFVAAIIGAFVALQVGHYTNTKDDFSILRFVDDVSIKLFETQGQIVETLTKLHHQSETMVKTVGDMVQNRLRDLPPEKINEELDAIVKALDESESGDMTHIRADFELIKKLYIDLDRHMHTALFTRVHPEVLADKGTKLPLTSLAEVLPEAAAAKLPLGTLQAMGEHLAWFAKNTRGSDWLLAFFYLPGQFEPILGAGMALYSPFFELEEDFRLKNGGPRIRGYCVNVGGACIASLCASLPDKTTMQAAFEKILKKDLPKAAQNYISLAGPSLVDMAPDNIGEAIDEIVKHPMRLIVLFTDDEAVFYDPQQHGDIHSWPLKPEENA